ncbi:MAG: hypothetical protein PF961_00615 [Planctomycetota bacterium]|jgi:hypothetical protein|nr:hypothetical protein [Planctomycetota bacterium]
MKWLVLACVALVMGGCGVDLNTSYGTLDQDSVNGFSVINTVWDERFDCGELFWLSDRSQDFDTLIHLQRETSFPSTDAWDFLFDWLDESDGRQCVVVLRDGGVGEWILLRWLRETQNALGNKPEPSQQRLLELGRDAIIARLEEEDDPALLSPGDKRLAESIGLIVTGDQTRSVQRLDGLLSSEAPPMMQMRSALSGGYLEPLISADDEVFAGQFKVGASRMIVVANASPLVDAALVDHRSRAVLAALGDEIESFGAGRAGWLRRMRVRSGDPVPPSILSQLFGQEPFRVGAFHLLVLLVVYAWFRAAWLGRVNPRGGHRLERFSRHVDALAWKLQAHRSWRPCVKAVARYMRQPRPESLATEQDGSEAVDAMLRPAAGDGPHRPQGGNDG